MSISAQIPTPEALPHRRMEAWKWSDVRAALAKTPAPTGTAFTPLALPDGVVTLRFLDGVLQDSPDLPHGVQFDEAGKADFDETLPMAALASTLAHHHYALQISASLSAPLCLRITGQGPISIAVTLAPDCTATIIEDHVCAGGFANVALGYDLGKGAHLKRLLYQQGDASAVHVVTARMALGEAARLDQFSLGFGARLSRLETRLSYQGIEAKARLNGAYLLDDDRHSDQTFHVDHDVEDCTTRQLVRGVVKDRANGVFQGKFYVGRGGQHTDASMNHDALLLNGGACINAKPELEIYADDVACAHGNTSGALDEHALFYMRQRGLDEAGAKALLIRAFLGAAFDDLKDEALHDMMLAPVMNWLEAAL
ncbi:MAG: Fe-S cluster assembly protein SufD [Robiginitomaculum sp.]|nr:MAG: Fe-S cluster assembly protein SufD [Robiginitomaculum sp.]